MVSDPAERLCRRTLLVRRAAEEPATMRVSDRDDRVSGMAPALDGFAAIQVMCRP